MQLPKMTKKKKMERKRMERRPMEIKIKMVNHHSGIALTNSPSLYVEHGKKYFLILHALGVQLTHSKRLRIKVV